MTTNPDDETVIARAKELHRQRQREGHKTPDWDGLSEMMRDELIYQARTSYSPFCEPVNGLPIVGYNPDRK